MHLRQRKKKIHIYTTKQIKSAATTNIFQIAITGNFKIQVDHVLISLCTFWDQGNLQTIFSKINFLLFRNVTVSPAI